jgi:hypothetical protein
LFPDKSEHHDGLQYTKIIQDEAARAEILDLKNGDEFEQQVAIGRKGKGIKPLQAYSYYSGIQLVNAGSAAEVFHSDVTRGYLLTG